MILYNIIFILLIMEVEGYNHFIDHIYNSSKIYHYNKNTEKIKRRIDEKIIEIPSETDRDGYIYGFTYNTIPNFNNYYIKIGRSIDPINRVIKQWKGELIFCIHTPYNKKAESLIHLYLNYARRILEEENGKTHIEWFYFQNKEEILGLIMAIRDIIIKNDCINRYEENINHTELGNLKNPQIYNKLIDLNNINLNYEEDPNIKNIMNNVEIILNKETDGNIESKTEEIIEQDKIEEIIEQDKIEEIIEQDKTTVTVDNKGILVYIKYYINKIFCCCKPN